jgi:hypothetical protein
MLVKIRRSRQKVSEIVKLKVGALDLAISNNQLQLKIAVNKKVRWFKTFKSRATR